MPTYTFECRQGHYHDRVLTMRQAHANMVSTCPECGMKAKRVYLPPNVIPDDYGRDIEQPCVHNPYSDDPLSIPKVRSRSELKRLADDVNRMNEKAGRPTVQPVDTM